MSGEDFKKELPNDCCPSKRRNGDVIEDVFDRDVNNPTYCWDSADTIFAEDIEKMNKVDLRKVKAKKEINLDSDQFIIAGMPPEHVMNLKIKSELEKIQNNLVELNHEIYSFTKEEKGDCDEFFNMYTHISEIVVKLGKIKNIHKIK